MPHVVKINEFEGPLDLLLDLIEQKKLDVTQVSLAKITDDYLEYVKKLEEINVESIVDFLVIASQLLVIKSRALLPILEQVEEEALSSETLAERLQELKKFRKAAEALAKVLANKKFSQTHEPSFEPIFYPPPKLKVKDLIKAYQDVIDALPAAELLDEEVVDEVVTLEDKLAVIQKNLKTVSNISFGKLTDKASKTEIIVTFLAMLELMKQRLVKVDQDQLFGEITISTNKNKLMGDSQKEIK